MRQSKSIAAVARHTSRNREHFEISDEDTEPHSPSFLPPLSARQLYETSELLAPPDSAPRLHMQSQAFSLKLAGANHLIIVHAYDC